MPKASIICCSLNRKESLKRLTDSLAEQSCQDFEFILCEEEGNLVELKDKGWRKAKGEIVIWVDDDIECSPAWLETILHVFEVNPHVVGVTGPTLVPKEYLTNRAVFRGGLFKVFYNWFFLEGKAYYPGRITSCGASTLGANYVTKHSQRVQEVDFLEPSQFAMRKWAVEKVGGFDLGYGGVAEWCDVDLCYRVREHGVLLYHPRVSVRHYPIKDKTTAKRGETRSRYENYCKFARRYLPDTLRHKIYKHFLKTYFWLLSMKLVG